VRTPFTPDPAHPFQLVKFLSWSSLALILGTSLFLVVVIGNYAKQTVLEKDKEFARLLAENLNHQIYQRFTLPTVLGFGRIQLKQKPQYERLDQVVQSTIHGFKVLKIRVYDLQGTVSYAMEQDLVGKTGLGGQSIQEAMKGRIKYEVLKENGSLWSFFTFDLPDQSYVLRTTFPLRTEQSLSPRHQGTIIGILQLTQDITTDYESITTFQWLIASVALFSSLVLFLLLYVIIVRADKLLAERIGEKERLERRLHQNEKLASMGRMMASIAHEIRNPLGIIQSSAELLFKKAGSDSSPASRLSKAIFDESQRLSRTVNDFLDYARPKEPDLRPVDLAELLRQGLTFLDPELKAKRIEVVDELPDTIQVDADPDLLYRAMYNLLTNACQALNGAGRISLRWSEQDRRLEIQDSGPGFEPDLAEQYVEPFFTTKDTGTGLGLAIVDSIIKKHGGTLTLHNASQGGGRVTVTFPEKRGRGRPARPL
jgi:signal transduction histidine kinase